MAGRIHLQVFVVVVSLICVYSQHKQDQMPLSQNIENGALLYGFRYSVNNSDYKDIKHHEENRDSMITIGEYSVLLPDNTYLIVRYTVRGNEGFKAIVTKTKYSPEYELV